MRSMKLCVDAGRPERRARLRVDCVGVAVRVAKVGGVFCARVAGHARHRDRGAHRAFRLIRPVDAAGIGVERIDVADVGGDEHAAGNDRGRAEGGEAVRIAERPFHFQIRDVARGESRGCGGLEARVGGTVAPAVPFGAGGGIGERRIRRAVIGHRLRVALLRGAERPAAQKRGEHFFLPVGERVALRLHHAGGERVVNALGGHLADIVRRGSLWHLGIAVAAHAVLEERGDAGFRALREIRAGGGSCGWRGRRSLRLGRLCARRARACEPCRDSSCCKCCHPRSFGHHRVLPLGRAESYLSLMPPQAEFR